MVAKKRGRKSLTRSTKKQKVNEGENEKESTQGSSANDSQIIDNETPIDKCDPANDETVENVAENKKNVDEECPPKVECADELTVAKDPPEIQPNIEKPKESKETMEENSNKENLQNTEVKPSKVETSVQEKVEITFTDTDVPDSQIAGIEDEIEAKKAKLREAEIEKENFGIEVKSQSSKQLLDVLQLTNQAINDCKSFMEKLRNKLNETES